MGVGSRGLWVRGRCLGRGSTAGVYLAASVSDGMQSLFAVKSAELSKSGPVLQREQHILSSLCSPHVVACFGSDVTTEPDGRVLFNLFMEYVPGADLSAVVRRHGGLDEHAIRVYARGILHGLAYLHGRGIVHCDVKGQNILVREDDMAVKLADLGCAKRVDGGGGGGIIGGTPLYMAPEVARGEEQGPAADIWALGCTVIEMATGGSPWGTDVHDPAAALHRIAFSTDVPDLPCNISDDAKDFLGRCLSRNPRKRWSSEELLNHSFVKFSEHLPLDCLPEKIKRTSPKSTLDQVFWDSWPEEVGEEDEGGELFESEGVEYYSAARERLRQLFAGGGSWANPTTWEESSWIMIRNNETLRNERLEQRDEPSTSAGPWSVEPAALPGYSSTTGGSTTAVSMASYLLSQPSVLPFALADGNASDQYSSSAVAVAGDDGYDLVRETQNFIDQANDRIQTLCRDHDEQDTCIGFFLLQETKSYGFDSFHMICASCLLN